MGYRVKRAGWGKPFVLFIFILAVCISMVSFSFKYYSVDETPSRVAHLEKSMNSIQAAIEVDKIRQYWIQRILNIIDHYNKVMSYQHKYEIAEEIYKMSVKYDNLDIDLICATITHESALTWNPQVVSQAGAMGLMQIMPSTGIFLCRREGIEWSTAEEVLFNSLNNIRLGCRYLSQLINSYEIDGGLAAYNGGERRAALWIQNNRQDETILWEETRGYIPAVLRLYKRFQQESGNL
ncbi:transglycosylase SLT domain-containing protein [candidate division KSB1 bacterium]|nr:transglycosylase SLT domain-containing protein [candidate division KSB1 bacterium]